MTSLRELGPDHCELLLRSERFGRVSMLTPHGVDVVPVNYVVQDRAIVIRTSSGSVLARYGHGNHLVFEVDAVDATRWSGWSVIARGPGEVRDVDLTVLPPAGLRPKPWADGDRGTEVRLAWRQLSGRSLGATLAALATPSTGRPGDRRCADRKAAST